MRPVDFTALRFLPAVEMTSFLGGRPVRLPFIKGGLRGILVNEMKLLLSILILLLVSPVMASAERESLRQWMLSRLTAELSAPHPDLNLVASFSMPLVTDVLTTSHPNSRRVVFQLRQQLEQWKKRRWQCGALVDLHLINGFLRRVHADVDLSSSEQQLGACQTTERLLDVANSLIFSCGFSQRHDQAFIQTGLRRLLKRQRQDGAFIRENGEPWYYLTSHALLALHFCDAEPEALHRARERLQQLLPEFQRTQFVDGVAESLIFLRWTGAAFSQEQQYLRWLRTLIEADGGICFRQHPGCKPHWHTVSLMMQLLLETDH